MSSRAHARRRLAAWDRYRRRWPLTWQNGRDPALSRWCAWPGCFSAYNAVTGPTTPGWVRIPSPGMALCGPHADLGHAPQLVRGAAPFTIRPTCTCGASVAERKATLGDLADWWHHHVEETVR